MKRKFLLFLIVLTVFLGFLGSWVANAQTCTSDADCATALNWCCWTQQGICIKSHTSWPSSPLGTSLTACSSLPEMVKYFYDWGIALGGIAAFIALIIGGFYYLTSMGNPTQLQEAKDRISSAVFGLILLLGSWLILNTINPELTTLRTPTFGPPPVDSESLAGFADKDAKPCTLVIAYEKVDYAGESEILRAEKDPPLKRHFDTGWQGGNWSGKGGIRSVRFFQEMDKSMGTEVTFDPITNTTTTETILFDEYCLNNKVVVYDDDPLTGNTTTTEIEMGGKPVWCENINVPAGNGDPGGSRYLKEGGSCIFEWSPFESLWLIALSCGKKMPTISQSTPNLKIYAEEERDIECARAVKYEHN